MWHLLESSSPKPHSIDCLCVECQEKTLFACYKRNSFKKFCFHVVALLTFGALYLVCYWKRNWFICLVCDSCSPFELTSHDVILVKDQSPEGTMYQVVKVQCIENQKHIIEYFVKRCISKRDTLNVHDEDDRLVHVERRIDYSSIIQLNDELKSTLSRVCFFSYRHRRYFFNGSSFHRLSGLDDSVTVSGIRNLYYNVDNNLPSLLPFFGKNVLTIESKSWFKLLVNEALHPFYIFQIASIILWSLDDYLYYAFCIFILSVVSVYMSLRETISQQKNLQSIVKKSSSVDPTIEILTSNVNENPVYQTVGCEQLFPGNIIKIPKNGCAMHCDAVIISGVCIVNESILTGESQSVLKSCLPEHESDNMYQIDKHSQHTLFSGTQVLQTRHYKDMDVLAVVVRTAFSTSKGELIRSILYPRPISFNFYRDSMNFVLFLCLIACFGMTYVLYLYVKRGANISMIILRCLDIITIVVPPTLPAAMTVGTYHAQNRLKKAKIFCLSPSRINICGKLGVICLDKTGTITEDGLSFAGIIENNLKTTFIGDQFSEKDMLSLCDENEHLVSCMASCHNLSKVDESLVGDPLDLQMFGATNWTLDEDTKNYDAYVPVVVSPPYPHAKDHHQSSIGLIKWFDFSSHLARMSVITRRMKDTSFTVYAKGAPEKLISICDKSSVPSNFETQLATLTSNGFRVLGLGYKRLDPTINIVKVEMLKRHQVECDLIFLGFLVMRNNLKDVSRQVITEMREARLRCVMITGDNIMTAISVGEDANLIDRGSVVRRLSPSDFEFPTDDECVNKSSRHHHMQKFSNFNLALTGDDWNNVIRSNNDLLIQHVLERGSIFARMSPDQKTHLIELLQQGVSPSDNKPRMVAMCGDGANDCGALKAAHVGISLSDSEASISAPFTSKVANISCLPKLVIEGRCALVTSFGIFKYMALYSFIQFVSVILLYSLETNLGDLQYLYVDLVITASVAVAMGSTLPHTSLAKRQPPSSLVKLSNLTSILVQIVLVAIFQAVGYMYLRSQSWFQPVHPDSPDDEIVECWETTTTFIISSFQYLSLAVVFSRGPPFRKPFYTNIPFVSILIGLSGLTSFLVLSPDNPVSGWLEMMGSGPSETVETSSHMSFRYAILGIASAHLLVALICEWLVLDGFGHEPLESLSKILKRKWFSFRGDGPASSPKIADGRCSTELLVGENGDLV